MMKHHRDESKMRGSRRHLIRPVSHPFTTRPYVQSAARHMARLVISGILAVSLIGSFAHVSVEAAASEQLRQTQAVVASSKSSQQQQSKQSAASSMSSQQQQSEHSPATPTLQQLIDQAAEGSMIELSTGSYTGPVRITKPLQLTASPNAEVTIVNNTDQPALTVEAEDVVISGVIIEDTAIKPAPSVRVTGDRVELIGLHVITGSDGIKLEGADHGEVRDSIVEWGGSQNASFTERGNGIDLYQSHDIRIIGNTVRGVFDGIYMEFSDDTVVEHNHIERSRYGIHCMYTNRTIIRHNTGTMNITGGMIMAVHGVEMTDNTFTKQSENVNSQGILLFDAHDSLVSDNQVEGNRVGVYVEYSSDNELVNNAVKNNFIGIQLIESTQNTITGNYFVGNVSDALASGNSDNDIQANYWDSFSGIDLDGNGRSDTRYAMNPFFQGLIKKKPAFQLFFQTPGIMFLESLYETGREGWTMDIAPLMAPPERWMEDQPHRETSMMITGWISIIFIALTLTLMLQYRRRII